jgi:hypothetical protein
MSVLSWLQSTSPPPPAALGDRVVRALGSRGALDSSQAANACLDSAITVLEELLCNEPLSRDRAADLLAADALVTYAFEAAASEGLELEAFADNAMTKLAMLVPTRTVERARE